MDAAHLNGMSVYSAAFAHISFTVGRIGVPLFLLLTGYLLLDRPFTAADCYRFWRKNWCGIVLTTEIWIVIYRIFLRAFYFKSWNTPELLQEMLFVHSIPMMHMWYMPMIIGLYIFLPLAARGLAHMDLKVWRFPVLAVGIYAFLVPVLQVVWDSFAWRSFGANLDLGYSGGVYGMYILFGYFLKKGMGKRLDTGLVWSLFAAFFSLTVGLQVLAYHFGKSYNVWYNCGLLFLCAVFLFEGMSRLKTVGKFFGVTWLSRNSFGLYLIHVPILMLGLKWVKTLPLMMPLKVFLLWSVALAAGAAFCFVIRRSAFLSRVLLYDR